MLCACVCMCVCVCVCLFVCLPQQNWIHSPPGPAVGGALAGGVAAREPEVGELEVVGAVEQQVLQLQVAVRDVAVVQVADGVAQLARPPPHHAHLHRPGTPILHEPANDMGKYRGLATEHLKEGSTLKNAKTTWSEVSDTKVAKMQFSRL